MVLTGDVSNLGLKLIDWFFSRQARLRNVARNTKTKQGTSILPAASQQPRAFLSSAGNPASHKKTGAKKFLIRMWRRLLVRRRMPSRTVQTRETGHGDTAVNSQLSFLVVSLIKAVAIQLGRPRLGTALPQRISV